MRVERQTKRGISFWAGRRPPHFWGIDRSVLIAQLLGNIAWLVVPPLGGRFERIGFRLKAELPTDLFPPVVPSAAGEAGGNGYRADSGVGPLGVEPVMVASNWKNAVLRGELIDQSAGMLW